MITNHTELLNALASKYSLNNYLEIGVHNPHNNFYKINCRNKTGVDPQSSGNGVRSMTSDDYFAAIENNDPKPVFDLGFIDGLHTKEQVKRDFENLLKYLSDDGFIVIHDVLPENEKGTRVPRKTKQWWGDVYKWAMHLHSNHSISFKTFDIDNGCMLVWKEIREIHHPEFIEYPGFNHWEFYIKHSRTLMNVTDAVEI